MIKIYLTRAYFISCYPPTCSIFLPSKNFSTSISLTPVSEFSLFIFPFQKFPLKKNLLSSVIKATPLSVAANDFVLNFS